MRYDFSRMDADAFELMVRSLNERIFGVRCEQYGLGPDGQREFVFEGNIKDSAGVVFEGRTAGQVKYKYITTKEDDYTWLVREIEGELQHFREKETDYIPDNYLFYTNIVLTPAKDKGVKDKIEAYVEENNDIIKHFYVRGYDEICAMLDNNRDVAVSYAATILPGDLLMKLLDEYTLDYLNVLKKCLYCEFEEEMYPRLEQAGSVVEKKIPIERVCVDINVTDRRQNRTVKFASRVFRLGNEILGYKRADCSEGLKRDENFVLIGGPGKGKSTISQFIAQIYRAYSLHALGYHSKTLNNFIREFKKSYDYRIDRIRIPFKVALREYAAWIRRKEAEENHSIIQYMRERIEKFEGNTLSVNTLHRMLKEQAWVFFFDGLDEVPESSNRQEVLKQISLFISLDLRDAQCDCMIIGTTREQGYSNDFDEEKYMHMEVTELSKDDSCMYIKKLFEVMEEQTERREEYIGIMNEALEDETTSRLMQTPLQVTIIAILVKSGGKPPHDRYSLFRQYYDIMVKREKQKGIVATLNDNTDWMEEIHYLIGYRLQSESEMEQNASAEISREELEKEISSYVRNNQDDFYEMEDEDQEKENEFFMTITQRICFLSENREGFYSFTIRSMQEFFAGTYLVKGRSDEEAIYNMKSIAYSSYWRNVLLFALGYIELERKSLEEKIGLLCSQMNGADNIEKKDYTSDNLCLFGSWLAADILIENIFRGKSQNKYIVLAAKALVLDECANYNKFSSITGAQKDKLVRYMKENYQNNNKDMFKSAKFYLKLDENIKNDLTCEIEETIKQLNEEQVLMLDIDAAERGMQSGKVEKAALCRLKAALEKGEVKQFLPDNLLKILSFSIKKEDSIEIKKNIILQCLYSHKRGRKILESIKNRMGLRCSVNKMFQYLNPLCSKSWGTMIRLTESIQIMLHDEKIDKTAIMKIQQELQKMGLDYLVEFCDFLQKPAFEKYQKLYKKLDEEEEYLSEKYRFLLWYYTGRKICAEEEFQKMETRRLKNYERLLQGSLNELFLKNSNIILKYHFTIRKNAFQEMLDNDIISFEELGELSDEFFYICLFAAGVAVEQNGNLSDTDEKEADALIRVIYEAVRRRRYEYREKLVIAALLGSRFRGKLWSQIPDFLMTDEMLEKEFVGKFARKDIQLEVFERVISSIISKLICDDKENGYLSLIPILVAEPMDIRKYISENEMKELEQIEYSAGVNLLAMKLLKMCMSENKEPGEVLDSLLQCNVKRKFIYMELETMLRYCSVRNKEKFWVETYLRLEEEEFDESSQIRKRILQDMMDAKYNALKTKLEGNGDCQPAYKFLLHRIKAGRVE